MNALKQQQISGVSSDSAQQLAKHDPITGLPGREMLLHQVKQALQHPCKLGYIQTYTSIALIYLNIDRFHVINESLGREAGNSVLREVTHRIVDMLDNQGLLVRLDNDDFAAFLSNMPSRKEVVALARKIRDKVGEPLEVAGRKLQCAISTGVDFVSTSESFEAESIVFNAATAMNRAKRKTMGKIAVYTHILDGKEQLRTLLESDMQQALDVDEFAIQFQPVYKCDGENAQLYGFEALARWNHSLRGLIAPDVFINIAERSGNIIRLGNLLAEKALKTFAQWRKNSPSAQGLRLNINASAIQINFSNFDITFMALLKKYAIPSANIKLELTETALIKPHSSGMRRVLNLRNHGIELSMDDFGVGYSSLAQLSSLPLGSLKIDKQFVDNLSKNPRDRSVVKTILALARDFELSVIAEGVETEEQWRILMNMGCTLFQGYYFGKPLLEEKAWELIVQQDNTMRTL